MELQFAHLAVLSVLSPVRGALLRTLAAVALRCEATHAEQLTLRVRVPARRLTTSSTSGW